MPSEPPGDARQEGYRASFAPAAEIDLGRVQPCGRIGPVWRFGLPTRRHGGGLMNFTPASEQIKAAAAIQLSVAGVGKRFGGVTAVEDVSIDVPKGRIVSIIGPNGAGKTSLLNMISGFYKPDTGRIALEGRDITHSRRARSRRSAWRARSRTSPCSAASPCSTTSCSAATC